MTKFLSVLTLLFTLALSAQGPIEGNSSFGGDQVVHKCTEHLFSAEMTSNSRAVANQLLKEGKLPWTGDNYKNEDECVQFIWPVRASEDYPGEEIYATAAFIDHDTTSNVLDFMCGDRSYNLSSDASVDGSLDHFGTDIFMAPYPWYSMLNKYGEAIAAADGVIVGRYDGSNDMNCDYELLSANAVDLLHEDGSLTRYFHLALNSLTEKEEGDFVEAGEFLGLIGSSGITDGPHLHFSIIDSSDTPVDPWIGPCNPSTLQRWVNQKPYNDSGTNHIIMSSSTPVHYDCPAPTYTFESEDNVFEFGDEVVGGFHFRHFTAGDTAFLKMYLPNNSNSWSNKEVLAYDNHYNWAWYYWDWYMQEGTAQGLYTMECFYGDEWDFIWFEVVDTIREEDPIEPEDTMVSMSGIDESYFESLEIRSLESGYEYLMYLDRHAEVSLFNSMGQRIQHWKQRGGDHRFDLAAYSRGVYFVQVRVGSSLETRRVIRQ